MEKVEDIYDFILKTRFEYWIEDDRFFVCNDTENMDNIDEISKENFIKRFVSLVY